MRIGLDLDGVLSDFTVGYKDILNRVTRRVLPDEDPPVWEWPKLYGVTPAQEEDAWHIINTEPDFWQTLPNMPDFTDVLQRRLGAIAHDHDVYFVTDRPTKRAKQQTEDWLRQRSLPQSVLVTPHKGLAAEALALDIFVDDKPANVLAVANANTRVYLFNRRWNSAFVPPPAITPIDGLLDLFRLEAL